MSIKVVGILGKLARLQVASCTCYTKTPDVEHHDKDCNYRILMEADQLIRDMAFALGEFRNVAPKVMKHVMYNGRDGLLLADEVHRAETKAREALHGR